MRGGWTGLVGCVAGAPGAPRARDIAAPRPLLRSMEGGGCHSAGWDRPPAGFRGRRWGVRRGGGAPGPSGGARGPSAAPLSRRARRRARRWRSWWRGAWCSPSCCSRGRCSRRTATAAMPRPGTSRRSSRSTTRGTWWRTGRSSAARSARRSWRSCESSTSPAPCTRSRAPSAPRAGPLPPRRARCSLSMGRSCARARRRTSRASCSGRTAATA